MSEDSLRSSPQFDSVWLPESPPNSKSSTTTQSFGTPGETVILKSDSKRYINAETRSPEALTPVLGKLPQSMGFVDRVESLKELRVSDRRKTKAFIPKAEESPVVKLTSKLQEMGLGGKWRIPDDKRKVLEEELSIDTHTLMENLAVVAQHLAVPVISVFHVGAAGLGASGAVYLGTNVEISSGQYSSNVCGFHYCVHAEQAVVLNMFEAGERALTSIYISHVPCGVCRQFMAELPDYRNIQVWTPQLGAIVKLGDLLPHSFGPADLGMRETLIPWGRPNAIGLSIDSEAKEHNRELAMIAAAAARRAHAPYTSSFAGAVLVLKNGQHRWGSAAESAAFNPSVSPLQMALLALWVHGDKVQDIESACLAEDPSSPVTYKGSDGALLGAVAPWASLWLMPLEITRVAI